MAAVTLHACLPLKPLSNSLPVYPFLKVEPHVIIQHHCTSCPLSLCASHPTHCEEMLTHGWPNQQFWVRGIFLEGGHRCELTVIHYSAGTNPCGYTQHAVTVVITSWAPFHQKTCTPAPLHSWWVVKSKEATCVFATTALRHSLGLLALFLYFKADVLPAPYRKKVIGLLAAFLWFVFFGVCIFFLSIDFAFLALLWFPPIIPKHQA